MHWIWNFLLVVVFPPENATIPIPERSNDAIGGSSFYEQVLGSSWEQRESLAVSEILSGNVPEFYRQFVPIHMAMELAEPDSTLQVTYFVATDYLSIGGEDDWARIPLSPMAAQEIADSFECFLPTRKMVDDIYEASVVKLKPVPLLAYRDSSITFWHHHLIIEGQRKGRTGLIAGIKKDVILSSQVERDKRDHRVAIYGWHREDSSPIQPLYTGHINYYVDYSHGIRLVYRKIKVNDTWMDYTDILRHETFSRLLCDEEVCDFERY